jgi:hypothetical protein
MGLKLNIITLTLASFVLVPMMPNINATSSELSSWSSEVYSNLDGIHRDYDFKKFSPDLESLVQGVVNTYNNALNGVVSFYEGVQNFFSNPAILLFDEDAFSDDPLTIGYIPDGRMTQIIYQSTFLSNQQVVDQVLSTDEITFILTNPLFSDWPWIQGYFFIYRNTTWPINDNSIYYYCTLV